MTEFFKSDLFKFLFTLAGWMVSTMAMCAEFGPRWVTEPLMFVFAFAWGWYVSKLIVPPVSRR